MKKKVLSMTLVLAMSAAALAGCRSTDSGAQASKAETSASTEAAAAATEAAPASTEAASGEGIKKEDLKVGVIYVGDENEGYTAAHMAGIKEMKESLGLSDDQIIAKTNIGEDESCYDAAADLVDNGCQIIFANSFGHGSFMLQAAQDFPDVQFCHATGADAKTAGLSNFHNYFTAVYESRYVSGVVAGLKLNEMLDQGKVTKDKLKIGYVGAYPYAEVVSGFTSFFLGVRSVCPDATMEVKYTNSWADLDLENQTATQLIADGCVLISQHADTTGAPSACEDAGVPCVGYNIDMIPTAPNEALTSASINWGPYYTYAVQSVLDGTQIDTDWCQGYNDGADKITALNDKVVAEGTADKVKEVEDAIKNGTLHVFDTSKFTVGGKSLEDALAAGDLDSSFQSDDAKKAFADSISDGYYHESDVKLNTSAPSFAVIIDGIDSQVK